MRWICRASSSSSDATRGEKVRRCVWYYERTSRKSHSKKPSKKERKGAKHVSDPRKYPKHEARDERKDDTTQRYQYNTISYLSYFMCATVLLW